MWINYLKIAFRNLIKNKTYSIINIGGLAVGMACSFLILLWIRAEYAVDNFHENGEQLYQVYLRTINEGQINARYNTPALLPAYLKDEIPDIEKASGYAKVLRLSQQGETYETFQAGEIIQKMRGSRAGDDFFNMFSYPLILGNADQALDEPNDISISQKMATVFFGSPELALGKSIEINNDRQLVVSAVFEDLPSTASNQFDYLLNWDYWVRNDDFKGSWGHFGTLTYVQLQPNSDPKAVEAKMQGLLDEPLGISPEDNFKIEIGLQPYASQYLYGNFENGQPTGSRITYVRLLGFVAFFILIVAVINFTNLSTARSLQRTLEVGIRKVIGAKRHQVAQQFLVEAFLLTFIALPIALFLIYMILPTFNQFTQKAISLPLDQINTTGILLGLTLAIGFFAGLYPAIILSTVRAHKVLKGEFLSKMKNLGLQKSLIVFQFTLAILLIIGTIVITQQTNFLQSKDLGYNRENVLYLPLEGTLLENYLTFKEEALRMPGVKYIDRSSQTPHNMGFSGSFVNWEGRDDQANVIFTPNSVGYDYIKLMGIDIIEGRDFSSEYGRDSSSFIINELAAKQMGLEQPVGEIVSIFGKRGPIVGVVADFHTKSLHQTKQPIILDVKEGLNFGSILVRTEAGKTKEAIANLKAVHAKINPGIPFSFLFMDNEYGQLYNNEQIIASLSNAFGLLAIFISCLGLLGLAIFAAEQRVKEIGIRKVLGASVAGIVGLLSKDFLKLVFIAFIIASPIAWHFMNQWLQGFAYSINIQWWVFALSGFVAFGIAFLTVSFQSMRAALANPVNSLRNE